MSIYPVHLMSWFPNPKTTRKDSLRHGDRNSEYQHFAAKVTVENAKMS